MNYLAYILSINLGKVLKEPLEAQLNLTEKCNLRCIYCPLYSKFVKENAYNKEISKKDMNITLAKKIVFQLKKLGTKQVLITGEGEPFLYKRMKELIKYIKREKLGCGIITNGVLLNSDLSKFLIKNKVERIIVSINAGDEKEYKRVTNTDYFIRVTKNLKELNLLKKRFKSKKPKVLISFIPLNSNVKSLINIILLAKTLEAKLMLKKFIPFKGIERFQPKYDKKFKNTLINFEKLCKKLKINNNINAFISEVYYPELPFCYVGWLIIRIKTNGDVVPCCSSYNHVIGNLKKKSLKEIWHSDNYKKFRELSSDYNKRILLGCECDKCQLNRVNKKVETFDLKKNYNFNQPIKS